MNIMEEVEELIDRVINEYDKQKADKIFKDMIERLNEMLEN